MNEEEKKDISDPRINYRTDWAEKHGERKEAANEKSNQAQGKKVERVRDAESGKMKSFEKLIEEGKEREGKTFTDRFGKKETQAEILARGPNTVEKRLEEIKKAKAQQPQESQPPQSKSQPTEAQMKAQSAQQKQALTKLSVTKKTELPKTPKPKKIVQAADKGEVKNPPVASRISKLKSTAKSQAPPTSAKPKPTRKPPATKPPSK